jgi:hypothetical protein
MLNQSRGYAKTRVNESAENELTSVYRHTHTHTHFVFNQFVVSSDCFPASRCDVFGDLGKSARSFTLLIRRWPLHLTTGTIWGGGHVRAQSRCGAMAQIGITSQCATVVKARVTIGNLSARYGRQGQNWNCAWAVER